LSPAPIEGHFLGEPGRRIFVLLRPARGTRRGCLLIVPPFAEEMNKTRRMLSDVGDALAQRGFDVVLPDLFGTGDSEGNFEDATWECWRDDLATVSTWCTARGAGVTSLLAVRLGCALASDALRNAAFAPVATTVLWQPVFDGERFMNQFLRLRVAASMMDGGVQESVVSLRDQLNAGRSLEVAGYAMRPALVTGIDAVKAPKCVAADFGRVYWFEVVQDADAGLPPASARIANAVREGASPLATKTFFGEPFWSSTEIVRNETMVTATIDTLVTAGGP
jgi:exosortase A-associated hydrolase 2